MNQQQFNPQFRPQQQGGQQPAQHPFAAPAQHPGPRPGFAPARPVAPAPGQPQQFRPQQQPAFRGGPAQGQAQFAPQAPAPSRGNPFAGISQARARQDANYDRTGTYIQRIDSVKWIGPDRPQKTQDQLDKIIITKTTLSIVAPAEDGNSHRIGEQTTHAIKNDPRYNYFLPEVKAFVANVVGCPDEAVTPEMIFDICDESQNPLGGVVVECAGRGKATQRAFIVVKNYRRRLRAHEIQQEVAPEVVAKFFPGDTLSRMAQAEAAEGQVPEPMQQEMQLPPPPPPGQWAPQPQGFYPAQPSFGQ